MVKARLEAAAQDIEAQLEQVSHTPDTLTELFEFLKNQPEDVALEAFRAIRQGHSPRAILQSIGGDMSGRTRPSPNATARALLPPTQTTFEFQLVVQHPNVYRSQAPMNKYTVDWQLLDISPLEPENAVLQETLSQPQAREPATDLSLTVDPQAITSKGLDSNAMDLVDSRLGYVDIKRWTSIAISDRFAGEALSLYLKTNQSWWAFFDTDLFLDDLISGSTTFCSSLLVNALLAWSTGYAHYNPMAAALTIPFLKEALRIYERERDVDRLTTVAATSLMSMTWTTLGMDKAGYSLQCDNANMANRLSLYGESDGSTHHTLDLGDENVQRAAAATAWGSFNFQMVMSMSYRQEPLAKTRPRFRIPIEIWASTDRFTVPYFNSTYASVCQFWSLVFKMNYTYYFERVAPLSSASALFRMLLAWADELQEGVRRGEHNPDHVLNLHIWFHTAVIDLFRPFKDARPQPHLAGFAATLATPIAVVAASIQQLKGLVYQYRSNFESAKFSIVWQSGMLYLVNFLLRDLSSSQEANFYFFLCMRGYQHLARHLPFVVGVVQSVFALAVRQGIDLSEEATQLLQMVRSEHKRSLKFLSAYPVDLEGALNGLPGANLETLAQDFHDLTVDTGGEMHDHRAKPLGWKGSVEAMSAMLSSRDSDAE